MITKIFIFAVAILFLYIARRPLPVPNRQGTKFNDAKTTFDFSKPQKEKALTVASYNVQTGKSIEGVRNIRRAADVLSHVDIAGVQEVYAPSWTNKLGLGISQTETLAIKGNFAWLFCPTRYRWFRENRGNAILSKLPINAWQTLMLPDKTGISFRNMTVIEFNWQGQDCYFINTHLHTSTGKTEQLKKVLDEFNKYPNAILVGDFNSTPDTDLLENYLGSNIAIDAILQSNSTNKHEKRIDWIITKGWTVQSGKYIDKGVSDHPYYEVSLTLNTKTS